MRYRRNSLAHGEGSLCPKEKSQTPGDRTFQFSWDFGAGGCQTWGTGGSAQEGGVLSQGGGWMGDDWPGAEARASERTAICVDKAQSVG